MLQHLTDLIYRLEDAGIKQGAVALVINKLEEKQLLAEIQESCGVEGKTAHNGYFMGWLILVKDNKQ